MERRIAPAILVPKVSVIIDDDGLLVWSARVESSPTMSAERITVVSGQRVLAQCFLAISVPIETWYSWRGGLTDPYYLVKLVGWVLLGSGALRLRRTDPQSGLVFLAAGWAWFGANFWRAVADRLTRIASGQTLRLGSVELLFAGGCLLISLVGLSWCFSLALRGNSAE